MLVTVQPFLTYRTTSLQPSDPQARALHVGPALARGHIPKEKAINEKNKTN